MGFGVGEYGRSHSGEDTSRKPSNTIWKNCPRAEIQQGVIDGIYFHDDFRHAGAAESSTAFAWGQGYLGFGTAGVTMKSKTAVAGSLYGILEMDVDADDEEAYLSFDSTYTGAFGEISDAAGHERKLWFEARVRFDNVASGAAALGKAIGLAVPGANVTGFFAADAAALASGAFVGFRALAADGDGLDAVYKLSTTETVVKEAASGLSGQTLVADTFVKAGIYFDGKETFWFINGQLVNPNAGVAPAATSFPDASALVPILGIRQHGTGDMEADIDWWRFAQVWE